jgi:methylated-DNA-[protein]-cysteine S-methyltransferase
VDARTTSIPVADAPTSRDRTLVSTRVPSPFGELTLVADDDALVAVLWPDEDPDRVPGLAGSCVVPSAGRHAVLDDARDQLDEYFAGTRTSFDLPLRPVGTPFQLAAWAVLRTIPYGATMTYGEQARQLGDPNKARAVGAANGRNPLSIIVPCHRVTGASGSLTGFAGGLDAKRWLLDHERGVRALV